MTPLAMQMKRNGWTDSSLGAASGLSRSFIFRLRKGQRVPSLRACQKIGCAMGLDYRRLLPEPSEGASRR